MRKANVAVVRWIYEKSFRTQIVRFILEDIVVQPAEMHRKCHRAYAEIGMEACASVEHIIKTSFNLERKRKGMIYSLVLAAHDYIQTNSKFFILPAHFLRSISCSSF